MYLKLLQAIFLKQLICVLGIQLEVPAAPKECGRLLACGQGDVGQLGLGDDIMETTR